MNNIYTLLKLNKYIRSTRIKCFGIFCLHIFKRRYLGIFLDPVLACNLRCKMCYFSDPERRKTLKGSFVQEDLPKLAKFFFKRTLKLQIGCGAEPSIYPHNELLIQLAKEYGIPYVSMTTNGTLFKEEDWWKLVKAGLDEVTISTHGVKKETYEYFMEGASFEYFHSTMESLTAVKGKCPSFNIRINYTVNKDNIAELKDFFHIFGKYKFDVIQIRPIQEMGDTAYADFSWEAIVNNYEETVQKLREECIKRNIICLAPEKINLTDDNKINNIAAESTYCYISPQKIWEEDPDWRTESFNSFSRRINLSRKLFRNIFKKYRDNNGDSKKLNYTVS